jgi:hypothetical protein
VANYLAGRVLHGDMTLPQAQQKAALTNTPTQITTTSGCENGFPSLNADGARLAFASECDLTGQNADGNSEVFLAGPAAPVAGGGGDGCQVSPLGTGGTTRLLLLPAGGLLAMRRRSRCARSEWKAASRGP